MKWRSIFAGLLAVALLLVIAVPALASSPGQAAQPSEPMLLLLGLIAGFVAAPAAQFIKNTLKLTGDAALWAAFLISALVGLVVAVLFGLNVNLSDPIQAVAQLGEIAGVAFALATLLYKQILGKLQSGPLANFAAPMKL